MWEGAVVSALGEAVQEGGPLAVAAASCASQLWQTLGPSTQLAQRPALQWTVVATG